MWLTPCPSHNSVYLGSLCSDLLIPRKKTYFAKCIYKKRPQHRSMWPHSCRAYNTVYQVSHCSGLLLLCVNLFGRLYFLMFFDIIISIPYFCPVLALFSGFAWSNRRSSEISINRVEPHRYENPNAAAVTSA